MKQILAIGLGAALATVNAGEPIKNPVVIPDKGAASCGLVGDLTVTAGYTSLDGDAVGSNEADDFASLYAEVQLGWQLDNGLFVQADIFGEMTDVGGDDDSFRDGFGGALHIMRRDEAKGLGVFAGGLTTDQDNNTTKTSDRWFAGVEGQLFRSEADYYFQLGYLFGDGGNDDNGDDSITEAVFIRAAAQKELSNGLILAGELGGAWGEMDSSDDDATIYTAGISITKPLCDCTSLGLGYQYAYYEQDGDENDEIDEHFLGLTFTYTFGGDAAGNSTDLGTPDFLRWSGITGGQLE